MDKMRDLFNGGSLEVGDRYNIAYDEDKKLPTPTEGFYWELAREDSHGRTYIFRRREPIVNNHYQVGAEVYVPNHKIGTPPVNDPNLYWEQVNHNAHGRHYVLREHKTNKESWEEKYETLRRQYSEVIIEAEKAKDQTKRIQRVASDRHEEYVKEVKLNERLQRTNTELREQNDKLMEMTLSKTELEETCKESGMNPDWVETDNLHKERMRLNNESIELDNLKKRAEINKDRTHERLEAYAHQVRDQAAVINELQYKLVAKECVSDFDEYQVRHSPISAKFHTDRLYKNAIWLWGVVVAFAINEVIQWVTR